MSLAKERMVSGYGVPFLLPFGMKDDGWQMTEDESGVALRGKLG
jgi:hypothetical protein